MTKRLIDTLLASAILVVTLPLILVLAVGSAISLRAWPLFVQDRIGKDGRTFRFVKIRTLPPSTPSYLDKHHLHVEGLPRFVRSMRLLHLDELPQLFLVVAGRMSLVGPRPEMPVLHQQLDAGFAALRTSVRPGCTGLWQVGADSPGLIGEAPEYDRFYLAHHSARLDLWILAQTARMMIGLGRVHSLNEIPVWTLPTAPSIGLPARAEASDREGAFSVSEADLSLTAQGG